MLKWFIGALAFHCIAVLYGAALLRYLKQSLIVNLTQVKYTSFSMHI
jgi:hypothetical protein